MQDFFCLVLVCFGFLEPALQSGMYSPRKWHLMMLLSDASYLDNRESTSGGWWGGSGKKSLSVSWCLDALGYCKCALKDMLWYKRATQVQIWNFMSYLFVKLFVQTNMLNCMKYSRGFRLSWWRFLVFKKIDYIKTVNKCFLLVITFQRLPLRACVCLWM